MRIKRFIAPDMRTALRMVREEQGPDAVILSNRPAEGGIEVVAATDYDEALVQQALRSAAPGLDLAAAPKLAAVAAPMAQVAAQVAARPAVATRSAHGHEQRDAHHREPGRAEAMIAALTRAPAPPPIVSAPAPAGAQIAPREAALAHAVEPCLAASLPAATRAPAAAPAAASVVEGPASAPAASTAAADATTPGDDFRAVLARLIPEPMPGAPPIIHSRVRVVAGDAAETKPSPDAAPSVAASIAAASALVEAAPAIDATVAAPDASQPMPCAAPSAGDDATPPANATPTLQAVPAEDPALGAMRAELAAMRALMERQLGELAVERLRGSPARAAVFDALRGYGCDEALSQAVATRIDPRMPVEAARVAMLDELARMLSVSRAEPLDDGGVIALVGPTGAGKTTTAARLAARFAERHRARDVALVTTDTERAGAREQLHAHGRRLGITVCEAEGPEALERTLAQLADYPLVLVDTAGYAARDRALLGQILWLRTARRVRSLLVLPANANPHDLAEVARRYRPATPEGVVLTKVDETGHLGAALSVLVKHDLALAYTSDGQQLPDIAAADPARLVQALETLRRAAANPLATEDRHAVA